MPTAQELIEQLKQQQQMARYRKQQREAQRRQIPGQLNVASKGLYKGGQKVAEFGNKLATSSNPNLQALSGKVQSFGNGMQTASGRPAINTLKENAAQMLNDKLGLGASATPTQTALGQGLSEAVPSATSAIPSTITPAAESALGATAGTAGTTAAGTGSALGSAIGSATTAGTAAGAGAGTSAIGSAIGAAAPAATSAGAAGAAGAGAAAGGLGTAALGALGPIGIGLAAASMLYNIFNSIQKKKQQKAMQLGMENLQKAQQADAQKKAEAINGFDEGINAGLQQSTATTDNALKQDLMSQIAPQQQTQTPRPEEILEGQMTGGAAPVGTAQEPPQLPNIQIPMPDNRTMKQKLFDGFKDIYTGYQDNSRNGFMQGDMFNNLAQQPDNIGNEVLTNYQDQLLNAGYDQNVVDAVAEGKNSGYKEIDQWIKDNPEAFNGQGVITGGASKTKPKSIWNRVGEAFGTGQRLLSNPIVQGLIAGTLYGKDKHDALYGLGKGVEWAQNKAKSNYYSDTLGQPRQVFGGYDVNDYNANINAAYKGRMVNNAEQRIANMKDYQDAMIDQRKVDAEERRRHNEVMERNQQERTNAIKNRQQKQTYDPTLEPDFYDDYANYAEGEEIFNDDALYNQEVDDMLEAMNQGKGWFDKKATRAQAEAEVKRLHRQEQNDFYKKYRLNPMKGKIK